MPKLTNKAIRYALKDGRTERNYKKASFLKSYCLISFKIYHMIYILQFLKL